MSSDGRIDLAWYLGALDRVALERLAVKMIVKDDSNFDLLVAVSVTAWFHWFHVL